MLASCGSKRPPSTSQPQEDVKPGQLAGSSLLVGVVPEAAPNAVFLLTRLETTTSTPPIEIAAGETLLIPESDERFAQLQPLLKGYPAKQSYTVYAAEGSQAATVSGVAITRAGCEEQWAAYPLLATPQPNTKSEAVIVRAGEAATELSSLRLLAPTSDVPEAVRAMLEALPKPARAEETLWARLAELDGDEGAELFVARSLIEPLGDQGVRAATVEGLWFDSAAGAWKIIDQSSLQIAQEDLLRFPRNHGWERWAAPPVLVVDLENDKIAEVIRVAPAGYSLWRFDAGSPKLISQWVLAAKERCE